MKKEKISVFRNPKAFYLSAVLGLETIMNPKRRFKKDLFIFSFGEESTGCTDLMKKILSSINIKEFKHFHNCENINKESKNFFRIIIFGDSSQDIPKNSIVLPSLASMLRGREVANNKRITWDRLKKLSKI